MTATSNTSFRAPTEPRSSVTVLPPLIWSVPWSGTSDHIGLPANCTLAPIPPQTSWSLVFVPPSPTAAEEVARLRDRISQSAGLTRQDIARGIGVDRRSLSGFVTGEIRPTGARLRALRVLADTVSWAVAHYGVRARDILREDLGDGAPLDRIAQGRDDVMTGLESAAEVLGRVRRAAVSVESRGGTRDPLYLKAVEAWSDRIDRPEPGGRVRDLLVYEQDLSEAPRTPPVPARPRRRRI